MYPKILASKVNINPNTPPTHKACRNCKHFQNGFLSVVEYGKCLKFGEQNLVDGKITYQYAKIAREYDCKGDYFEQKEPPFYTTLFNSSNTIKNNEGQ